MLARLVLDSSKLLRRRGGRAAGLLAVLAGAAAGQQVIDFETTPGGGVPVDDGPLDAAYALGGTFVSFGFDTNEDLLIDSAPRFEARGGNPSTENGAYRTGPGNNLQNDLDLTSTGAGGAWILRRDLAIDPILGHDFLIVFSGTLPTHASGQVWDLDGGPGFYERWRVDALDVAGQVLAGVDTPFFTSKTAPPVESLDGWPWEYSFANLAPAIQTIRISYIGTPSPDVGFAFDNIAAFGGEPVNYCTAGTSASGCIAGISASGVPSASAASGFVVSVTGAEGRKKGVFFFGPNGRQALSWGNGTSFQCVVPPVNRGGAIAGNGTTGSCNGSYSQDLNSLWCPTCPKPNHNPGAGAVVQAQFWYRDPKSTSNQTTSLSNAIEVVIVP